MTEEQTKQELQKLAKEYIGDIMCDSWMEKIMSLIKTAQYEYGLELMRDIRAKVDDLEVDKQFDGFTHFENGFDHGLWKVRNILNELRQRNEDNYER